MRARSVLALTMLILLSPVQLMASEFQFRVIESEKDLPRNFCSTWKKGDYLVSFGEYLAIIGGASRVLQSSSLNYPVGDARGCILSFPPLGSRQVSNIAVGSPYLRLRSKAEYVAYASVEDISASNAVPSVRAIGSYSSPRGEKARVQTEYRFFAESGRIEIHSQLTNTGDRVIEDFDYSIYVNADTLYSFTPLLAEIHPDLKFTVYTRKGHALAWVGRGGTDGESPKALPAGESYEVRYSMMMDVAASPLLKRVYRELGIEPETTLILLKGREGRPAEIVVSDAVSKAICYRSFLTDIGKVDVPLLAGTYSVRANFFPAVREKLFTVSAGGENVCELENSPRGELSVRITNGNREYVPGKVTFIGLHPTRSPYFQPVNPMESGRDWETVKNSCFPGERGMDVALPVGTYLVYGSRGPEYSLDQKVVEVLEGEQKHLDFRINKVVDTTGLISVDPHMHTQRSDGNMSFYERLCSVVAEGVDVAVSSDHNYITNYEPELLASGLDEYLSVIAGNEVTISGMIHYNTYPVAYREDEVNHGAIDPLADSPGPLFQRSRRKDPGTLIQVNHPRSGTLGYFNMFELERESAAHVQEGFDTAFDVLEIVNGPTYSDTNAESIEDWLHLLNRGYFFPLVGSSDSHGIDRSEPGYSRTYVYYTGEKGSGLDRDMLIQSMREGRSFSSNGPIIDLVVNGSCRCGDTCTDDDGEVDVRIRAQSASWIAVDELRLIVNGERKNVQPLMRKTDEPLDVTLQVELEIERDSYIVLEALGKKSLYPVTQTSATTNYYDGKAILPYALTNPVFVDVDGNGKFDPPLSRELKLLRPTSGDGSQ